MVVKFFSDNFNARFLWSWPNGIHVTQDKKEIENLIGLGLRHEIYPQVNVVIGEETAKLQEVNYGEKEEDQEGNAQGKEEGIGGEGKPLEKEKVKRGRKPK